MGAIRELVSRLGAWLAVAGALGGCHPTATNAEQSDPPTVVVRSAITGGFEPGTAITPAGFVSLGTSAQAVRLGPRGHFGSDLALANGGVDIGSDSDAVAPWRVAGTLTIEPQARVTGDLTIGGTLARGAQTTLNGAVTQHASVPQLKFPSTAALLGQLGASFGTTTSADIFVGPGGTQTLAAGGRRVVNLTLQQGARLLVTGTSALEVTGSVNLGPQARITVSGGGRLLLYAHQTVETSTDAVIEQAGQALGRGLIVALGSGATMHWGTNAQFGPGLVYGVEAAGSTKKTTLSDVVKANGSLVATEVSTSPTSQIALVSRYLACVGGLAPVTVTLLHPIDRNERTVPPSATSIPVEGTVTNVASVDALAIQDAGATPRAVTVGADGHFTTTATLRRDGEPTNICVVARDCQDRVTQSCVLVGVQHDLDLAFTSPLPGDRVSVAAVNVTGRVLGGSAVSISGNGVAGGFLQDAFTIPQVPLAAGTNVITVQAQSASGDVVRRRLLVVRGTTTDVWDGNLEIDDARRVTLRARSPVFASPFPLVRLGAMSYRLLDAGGVALFQAGIPGTNDSISEAIDTTTGLVAATVARPFRYHVAVRVPALASARVIQFVDEHGQEVGRQAL